jgi:hypothetical protein
MVVGGYSVQTGQPAITTDNLILSLQPPGMTTGVQGEPAVAPPSILFYTDTRAQGSAPQTSESILTAPPRNTPSNTSNPSLGSGAIAGIAIGGVLIFAFMIGGWYFWRRKKQRTRLTISALADDELARRDSDGDKMVLDKQQTAPTTGAYQTQYQEMSGSGVTQELDRSHSYKYAIGGAHELKAEDRPGELPYAGVEEHGSTNEYGVVAVNDERNQGMEETTPATGTNDTTSQISHVSPHVEAQRRREVEWLEAEETRMRQRREALLQQSGGRT